ncbi:MAG: sugar phosphate isomerase/epimerase [Eubacterium sp.]|nr:sugar phosphate isomerase/epimerase [Eubacterium sp.]
MQLGIRLHDSKKVELEERLGIVKGQGFSTVHLALSKIEGLPSDTGSLTPGYAMYLKDTFAKKGLSIAILGCYLNLANPDENELKRIQKKYLAHLRFASLLGCGLVGTETGAPNTTYSYDKEACHSDEALGIFIKNLRPVVEYAEKSGVILAIEPVYKHIVWNPRRARAVLDAIDSPNLQIIFDPVNLLHPDNLDRSEEVIDEAIDLLGPDIALIHLKDYVLENGEMKAVGCGFGQMDYSRIIEFAVKEKPYIHATLENTRPENAQESLRFIQDIENKYRMLISKGF